MIGNSPYLDACKILNPSLMQWKNKEVTGLEGYVLLVDSDGKLEFSDDYYMNSVWKHLGYFDQSNSCLDKRIFTPNELLSKELKANCESQYFIVRTLEGIEQHIEDRFPSYEDCMRGISTENLDISLPIQNLNMSIYKVLIPMVDLTIFMSPRDCSESSHGIMQSIDQAYLVNQMLLYKLHKNFTVVSSLPIEYIVGDGITGAQTVNEVMY